MDLKSQATAVGLLLILASSTAAVRPADAVCANLHWGECVFSWGNNDPSNVGWLVPANTTLFTPFVTNATIAGWVEGTVTIFPFQYASSTRTVVGLYVNGTLVDTEADWVAGDGGLCTGGVCGSVLLKSLSPDFAVFSDYTMEFGLYRSLSSSIPSGSTVTLAFEADEPLWVSVSNQTSSPTYEESYNSYMSLPTSLGQEGLQSPHTVAAWVDSPNSSALGGFVRPVLFQWLLLGLICLVLVLVAVVSIVIVTERRASKKVGTGPPSFMEPSSS